MSHHEYADSYFKNIWQTSEVNDEPWAIRSRRCNGRVGTSTRKCKFDCSEEATQKVVLGNVAAGIKLRQLVEDDEMNDEEEEPLIRKWNIVDRGIRIKSWFGMESWQSSSTMSEYLATYLLTLTSVFN